MSQIERLLYRIQEAAEAVGVSRSKMYELIASGDIPSVRVGHSVRIPVEELKKWIAARIPNDSAREKIGA